MKKEIAIYSSGATEKELKENKKIIDYILEKNNYIEDKYNFSYYEDIGYNGYDFHRPELEKLILAMENKEVNILVTPDIKTILYSELFNEFKFYPTLIDFEVDLVTQNGKEDIASKRISNEEIIKLMSEQTKVVKKESYRIEIWYTEEARDMGEGFDYLEKFTSLKDAINQARTLYDSNGYACIEVIGINGKTLYNRDKDSEDFYIHYSRISKVSQEVVKNYIDNWCEHREQTFSNNKLYCEENDIFVAIDNTSGDCFVEEFNTEKEVFNWLLDLEEEKEQEQQL